MFSTIAVALEDCPVINLPVNCVASPIVAITLNTFNESNDHQRL